MRDRDEEAAGQQEYGQQVYSISTSTYTLRSRLGLILTGRKRRAESRSVFLSRELLSANHFFHLASHSEAVKPQ